MAQLHLSYVPVTYSEHVYVNGIEQQRGDWTWDATGNNVVLTSAVPTVTGDRLECRYAHQHVAHTDPYAAFIDYPTDVKVEYYTELGRDFFSVSFDTVHGKTPADGWSWQTEPAYVDGTGTLIYDGRGYPMRNVGYNASCGRWELIHQQNPSVHPLINRVTIQASGPNFNPGGLKYPEWQIADLPVTVGPVGCSGFSTGNVATATGSSPLVLTFGTAPAAGSSVLLSYQAFYSGSGGTVSGLGATWTRLAAVSGGTGSADSRPTELWLGIGCNGSGTTLTMTGDDMVITATEVTPGLTGAGAQTNTAVTPDLTAGPLTATSDGIAAYVLNAPSGLTETPASGWNTVSSVFKVQPVVTGTVVGATAASWAHAIVAVVH